MSPAIQFSAAEAEIIRHYGVVRKLDAQRALLLHIACASSGGVLTGDEFVIRLGQALGCGLLLSEMGSIPSRLQRRLRDGEPFPDRETMLRWFPEVIRDEMAALDQSLQCAA